MPCPDKIKHPTEDDARRELRKMKKQPNRKHGLRRLDVYLCAQCGYWHLGHYAPRVKTKQAEPKQPTLAEQRRAAKRKAAEESRQRMFADWADTLRCVAGMVEAEIARMEAARRNTATRF